MAPPAPGIKVNADGVPAFEDLPLRKGDPHHSAWGLYGDDDQLGTLNRLTDERVAAAARNEIRTGVRISLNWEMDAQSRGGSEDGGRAAFFNRRPFHQELIAKTPRVVNDDVWTFNSQVSSQWDGLRHYAYQREALFYGGVTMADIHRRSHRQPAAGPEGRPARPSTANGIHAWAERGIVGRGVLLDWESWRLQQRPDDDFDHFATTPIPLSELEACLAHQGTEIRFGDVLIVRSGWMAALARKTPAELVSLRDAGPPHAFAGVEQSEHVLRWLWRNFSAVAGDQPSFECWPSREDWALHEVLLAGWGCPIGELFDLERLACHCREQGRWSFFVTSEPCNVPGGVASPPNILAIF